MRRETGTWRAGITRLLGLIARRPDLIQRDADEELASLIDGRVERLVARGMSPDDARAEAVRRLGGSIDAARHDLRHSAERRERVMSIREWLDGAVADTRYALRGLRREPVFSGFAVLTLALGIGANAAMFGIVDKLLLRGPAHVRDADRVVRLYWTMRSSAGIEQTSAAFDSRAYANLVPESRAFSGLAMVTGASKYTLFGEGPDVRLVSQALATANLMAVVGTQPELGRFFTIDEQESQAPTSVVVLGYGLWQSDFGRDKRLLGRTVTISGRPHTVVGVAPEGFTGAALERVDVWFPLPAPMGAAARHWGKGSSRGPAIVGRLKPGVTFDVATADATDAYRRTYDGTEKTYADARISVGPLRYGPAGTEKSETSISRWLVGVSAIVLLVACANIVNLLLARAVRRRREVAVRIALGAGRARLLRLLVTGSVALAAIGATAGLAVAFVIGSLVRRVLLPEVDWTTGPVDGRVLAFSLVTAIITGILIGLLPALRAGRADVVASLKAGAREGGGNRSVVRSALMMAQAALAMVLLVGAGLFVRSFERVRALDLGVQTERVVVVTPRWPQVAEQASAADQAREEKRREDFAGEILGRLATMRGVEHVSAAVGMPFGNSYGVTLAVPGWDSLPKLKGGGPDISAVSADYFATVGTRLLSGRVFTSADRAGTEPVAIVSQTMASTLWPGRSALGQCLQVGGSTMPCSRVVGVVQDARRSRIHEDPLMHYYVPLEQSAKLTGPDLLVRPRGDAAAAIPALRAAVRQIDPSIRFVDAKVLQDKVEPQTRSWRIGAMMFSLFAVLALVVAAVGMFSVVAYLVEQRRHEIGVRVALGAQGIHVVALMLRGAVGITLAGVAIGAGLALAGGRFAQPLLFETSAHDPSVFGLVAAVLILVALVASGLPALRARRVDPITALRDE